MLRKLQTKKLEYLFIIYHELGHIINGDFDKESVGDASIRRKNALKKGKLVEEELKADEFAVRQVGKRTAIKALNNLKNERLKFDEKNKTHTSPVHLLSMREYDLRIQAINNLKIK